MDYIKCWSGLSLSLSNLSEALDRKKMNIPFDTKSNNFWKTIPAKCFLKPLLLFFPRGKKPTPFKIRNFFDFKKFYFVIKLLDPEIYSLQNNWGTLIMCPLLPQLQTQFNKNLLGKLMGDSFWVGFWSSREIGNKSYKRVVNIPLIGFRSTYFSQ